MTDIDAEIRRDHETAVAELRALLADALYRSDLGGPGSEEQCLNAADALLPLFLQDWEAVRRVRALCARALADDGSGPLGGFEDPTPVPGWVAAVENALNGAAERAEASR